MNRFTATILCLFFAFASAMAENEEGKSMEKSDANIVGHILNKNTQEHLPYITVTLKGTTIGTATDASGHYFLKNLPSGNFILEISGVGYKTEDRKVHLKAGKTLQEDFELEEDAITLDAVVVSANRNETKRRLAPTLVNVLNMKLFERTQSTDLAQGLKFQPGVRVETNCQNCGFSQVRINGLDGPYSQILIDSRPVFSALAGIYGLEQIPANMIERVEVLRGGGSALFGSSAIAGTINIITREPTSNSASVSHQIRGLGGLGTFENTTNFNGSVLMDNDKIGLTFFGQTRHRTGYDRDGDGYTEMPMLDGRTLGFRAFVRTSDYSKITAEYHNTHEFRRGGDLLQKEPQNAHIAEQLEHINHLGSINYTLFSPNGKHHLNVYGSFMKVNRKSYYGGGEETAEEIMQKGRKKIEAEKDEIEKEIKKENPGLDKDGLDKKVDDVFEERFGKGPISGLDNKDFEELDGRLNSYGRTRDLTWMAGAQYSYDIDKLLFMPSELTVGMEYMNDKLYDLSGYREAPIDQKVGIGSAFLQNEWKNERWSILIGARIDKHSMVKHAIISPRANLRFNPIKELGLRASYSRGFRAPQLFDEDLHTANAGGELITSKNDPNLKEETSNSWSASADWYHRFGAWQLNLMAEGFYTQLINAFHTRDEWEGNKKFRIRENTEGAKVYGGNIEAKVAYLNYIQLQAGVTVQKSLLDVEDKWDEDDAFKTRRIYRTPDTYAYFVGTANLTKKLALSISGNYTGSMLVGHKIPTKPDGTLIMFNDGDKVPVPAATIHPERMQYGEKQMASTYGPRTFKTPTFFELGCKLSYDFSLYKIGVLQVSAGVQNIFNAYQSDFDKGPNRDADYIYGPGSPRSYFAGVKFVY